MPSPEATFRLGKKHREFDWNMQCPNHWGIVLFRAYTRGWRSTDIMIKSEEKLTKAQIREALLLFEKGYQVHLMNYRQMPRNRPLWRLVELGLAHFDFGPVGSCLKQQGFMPLWSDPIC